MRYMTVSIRDYLDDENKQTGDALLTYVISLDKLH